jgi:putative ABC transport system permease protein
MGIAVRLGGVDPGFVTPAIRQRMANLDADLPLVRARPLDAIVEASTGETRLSSLLTAVFALVAAVLAGVGIYSLIACSVAQRTREIGIRVALGADRRAVVRLILGEGLLLAAIGLAAGLGGAFLLTRAMGTMLYEVSPTDPSVMAMTSGDLLAVAAIASLVPGAR